MSNCSFEIFIIHFDFCILEQKLMLVLFHLSMNYYNYFHHKTNFLFLFCYSFSCTKKKKRKVKRLSMRS